MSTTEANKPLCVAAILAGARTRYGKMTVHAVMVTEAELQHGIEYYARSLCNKTHGARSAGWAHVRGTAVTCPRCLRHIQQNSLTLVPARGDHESAK